MENQPYEGYFWQGEKVRLRPLHKEDAQKKWREWTDTHARRMLESQTDLPPVSYEKYEQDLLENIDFRETKRYTSFAIENLDGEFVGWINLFLGDARNGVFSAGMGIFREYRQKGYALEAFQIILRYGFYELRCQKCDSACLAENNASIRLHERTGFKEEGRRRREFFFDNQYHDEILFGLLKEEFEVIDRKAPTK